MITIEKFIDELASVSDEDRLIYNPYRNEMYRYNLLHYLHHLQTTKIDIMLIGEAPGYRGCALTGIPFTDEIQLKYSGNDYALGAWPRLNKIGNTSERSATIIWSALRKYHITPLLWNIFPFHPYQACKARSNRTPTQTELKEGIKYVHTLTSIFAIEDSQIFTIGKKAKTALGLTDDSHCIRHPANDYKKEFQPQFDLKIGKLYKNRRSLNS